MKKFLKALPVWIWGILFALLVATFFSNDFGLVDLQKTALVLAAGIDREEEDFVLTAQIALPAASQSGGGASMEITGRGATVADCLSEIHARTGWVPKLIYCDLIVLGESATVNVFDGLNFFLRNEYIPDACRLAACEGSAQALLSSASAVGDTSAIALGTLFSDAAQKSGQVMPTTLREFAIGTFGASASGYMPYVRAVPQEEDSPQQGGQTEGGQSGQSEQPDASQQGGQKILYSAQETALFAGGSLVAVLTPEETLAFSLLEGNVYAGTLAADGATYLILQDSGAVGIGAPPDMALHVDCTLQRCGENETSSPEELPAGTLSAKEEERLSELLTGYLASLWETCAQSGCDLFFFRRSLWRADPKEYAAWKDVPLADLSVRLSASVKSLR